jgi:hypothetical protein
MMIVGNDFFKRSLPPLTACATIRLAATLYAACVGVPSRNRIRIGTCTDHQSEFHPPSLHEAGSEISQILGSFGRDLRARRAFDR